MSTAALLSVEDYLACDIKPVPEYIDGTLRPRAMPTLLHSLVQHFLVLLLRRGGLAALQELTMRISAERYLVPDVVAARRLSGEYLLTPPALCIEVLSPGDRLPAMIAKCAEYHEWGVPFCWIVDPVSGEAWECHRDLAVKPVDRRGVLRAGEIAIRMEELFSLVAAEAAD